MQPSGARDRLLTAAAELMDQAPGGSVSTRAICARAGVRAPTLYHHFGSKQGLLDAVVEYGLGQYEVTLGDREGDSTHGPVADLRRGWDGHVRYGLDHPAFYVLLYGRVAPGRPCKVTAVAELRLRLLIDRVDRLGILLASPSVAVEQIVAANVGITLQLIALPDGEADVERARPLREIVLSGLIAAPALRAGDRREDLSPRGAALADAAAALADVLATGDAVDSVLSDGERGLLGEWLERLTCYR